MEPVTFEEFSARVEKVFTYLGAFSTTNRAAKAQREVLMACTETTRKYFYCPDTACPDAMSFNFPELLTNSLEYTSAHTIEVWVAACLLTSRDHQIDVYVAAQSAATRAVKNITKLIDKARSVFGGDVVSVNCDGHIKYKTLEGSENAVHIFDMDENTLCGTGRKKAMCTVIIEASHQPMGPSTRLSIRPRRTAARISSYPRVRRVRAVPRLISGFKRIMVNKISCAQFISILLCLFSQHALLEALGGRESGDTVAIAGDALLHHGVMQTRDAIFPRLA